MYLIMSGDLYKSNDDADINFTFRINFVMFITNIL